MKELPAKQRCAIREDLQPGDTFLAEDGHEYTVRTTFTLSLSERDTTTPDEFERRSKQSRESPRGHWFTCSELEQQK